MQGGIIFLQEFDDVLLLYHLIITALGCLYIACGVYLRGVVVAAYLYCALVVG
nr:MAG TPA: glycoprotein [Caudoviricetes sp.]